jgi:hypothetical protein
MEDYQKRQRDERENRLVICKRCMAKEIRDYDTNAIVAEHQIIVAHGPYEDHETYSLLQDGTLPHPKERGMRGLKGVWKVEGGVKGVRGVYPSYQVELLIAEYEQFSRYEPLGKRVGLEWVSPVTVGSDQ